MAAGTLETAFEGLAEGLLKGLDGRLLTAISAVNDAARTALSDTNQTVRMLTPACRWRARVSLKCTI